MTTPANPAAAPAIVVDGIRYGYGDTPAVDNVSFSVASGEILGFLGPNGASKSTTIKMLTGQLSPESGSIEMLGMNMPGKGEQIQERLGVCFEEKNLYLSMTGRENLAFFAKLFEVQGFQPEPLMERVDLSARLDDRVAE